MKYSKSALSAALFMAFSSVALANVPAATQPNPVVKVFAHKTPEEIKGVTTFSEPEKVNPMATPEAKPLADQITDVSKAQSAVPQVSYKIRAISNKEVKTELTIYTVLHEATTSGLNVNLETTKCEIKNAYVSTLMNQQVSTGFNVSLIPASLTEDGVNTALTISYATGNYDPAINIAEGCNVSSGDSASYQMSRVANLPLDQSTTFIMKDGTEVEITPHVTEPTKQPVKIEA